MNSNIDILIKELCPNGVEKVKLGKLLDYEQPTKYIVKSTEYDDSYSIPVLTAGQSLLLGYTDETDGIYNASNENPVIIFDDFTTGFHWITYDFKIKSSAMKLLTPKNEKALFRYVYLSMCCIGYCPTEHTRHWISKYSNLEIPLPPLQIQQEIVRILDSFTQLESNLDAEIALRQKQYEYYREKLLTFDEDIEKVSFGKSFQLKARVGWQGLTKKEYRKKGNYQLVTGKDFTNDHKINFSACVFVDKDRYDQDEYIQLRKDDVLITKDGTLGKIAYIDELVLPATLNGGVFVVRDLTGRILQKFTMHYLCSIYFKKWIKNNHTSGSIKHLTQSLLVNFMIPVPPLSRQEEIVRILDTFESLIENLKKEKALRQKQYEYYREKLLTFD